MSESVIVVTGGYYYPQSQVTEYSGIGGDEVKNQHKITVLIIPWLLGHYLTTFEVFFFRPSFKTFPPSSQAGRLKSKIERQWAPNSGAFVPVIIAHWAQAVPRLRQLQSGRVAGGILLIKLLWRDFSKILIVAGGLIGGYSDTTEVNSCDISWNQLLFRNWVFDTELQLLDYSNTDSGWREAGLLPSPRSHLDSDLDF